MVTYCRYCLSGVRWVVVLLYIFASPIIAANLVADQMRAAYPQVIGHAGASGYIPESTIEGYDLAANLGADYSEPDLVLTADGYFVAMHDLTLEGTTNVADYPEYEDRMSTYIIEGEAKTGYYAINFTLSEIQSLRVRQRFAERSSVYNWMFAPPSLQQIIQWQNDYFNRTGRLVGIYPEIKHPDWYNSMGYPMEDLLVEQLAAGGYYITGDKVPQDLTNVVPIAIQCFKNSSLKYLATITDIPLIQLMGISNEQPDTTAVYTEAILDEVMTYADGVGPDKKLFTLDWNVSVGEAMQRRRWAADRHLSFVPWSFQQEDKYIPTQFNGDEVAEMKYFYGCLTSSAIFHEFPDNARDIARQCSQLQGSCLPLCPYLHS